MSAARRDPLPILSRSTDWTAERISALSAPEVKQLRANAERLQEPEVAALCTEALKVKTKEKLKEKKKLRA